MYTVHIKSHRHIYIHINKINKHLKNHKELGQQTHLNKSYCLTGDRDAFAVFYIYIVTFSGKEFDMTQICLGYCPRRFSFAGEAKRISL